MKKQIILFAFIALLGVVLLAIYDHNGSPLNFAYDSNGDSLEYAYDNNGVVVFGNETENIIPVPTGNLTASSSVILPDLYGNGKGFTCTGLTSDGNYFYIGDIGATSPSVTSYDSKIIVTSDFVNVKRTINLMNLDTNIQAVQGVAYDSSNNSLWVAIPNKNKVYNIRKDGGLISSFSVSAPTGISVAEDGTLWILDYNKKILHYSKTGTLLQTVSFAYAEQLDQCFLDNERGLLYITAGENYTTRNNVYCYDINSEQQYIACTVDSYAVEGIWLGYNKMIILNDGYYHDATVKYNQANIYDFS